LLLPFGLYALGFGLASLFRLLPVLLLLPFGLYALGFGLAPLFRLSFFLALSLSKGRPAVHGNKSQRARQRCVEWPPHCLDLLSTRRERTCPQPARIHSAAAGIRLADA